MPDIVDMYMEAEYGPDAEGPPLTQEFIDSLRVDAGTIRHDVQLAIRAKDPRPTFQERKAAALARLRQGVNDQAALTRGGTYSY